MFAVSENVRTVKGEPVETYRRNVIDRHTGLVVEAGTNGYGGYDGKAGSTRTVVTLACDIGSFDFNLVKDDDGITVGIDITSCGDEALDALMKALDFVRDVLNDQMCGIND